MYWSSSVLGASAVKQQVERLGAPLLQIGSDTFRREDLGAVTCFNFAAAANLSKLLAKLHVTSTRDLYDRIAPADLLTIPGLGAISLAVLGAAFEAKGIGGAKPLEAWYRKHQQEVVTVTTIKHARPADAIAERQAKKDQATRKSARRRQAHALRVERFTKRRGKVA